MQCVGYNIKVNISEGVAVSRLYIHADLIWSLVFYLDALPMMIGVRDCGQHCYDSMLSRCSEVRELVFSLCVCTLESLFNSQTLMF